MKNQKFYLMPLFMIALSVFIIPFMHPADKVKAEDMETAEIITGQAIVPVPYSFPYEKVSDVIYTYDKKNKTITFSGSGELDWMPLEPYNDVTKIVIEEGITEIGWERYIGYFHGLEEISIPKSAQISTGVSIILTNPYLKRIYNNSSCEIKLSGTLHTGWNRWSKKPKIPFIWMVDGKKVTAIPPHSVADAIPKTYAITYDLNGGTRGKGEWFYQYRYGVVQDLPKPEKKGWLFAGWKIDDGEFATKVYSKISPKQLSDVKLKAVWRKIKIVKKKNGKGFLVLVSPKKIPQLRMIVSEVEDIPGGLKTADWDRLEVYRRLAGRKEKKYKTKDGMRVFHIKKFSRGRDFEKGKTYYVWFKYGKVEDFEFRRDPDLDAYDYINTDAYYFYKTKITF